MKQCQLEHQFRQELEEDRVDLNAVLITYVDLRCQDIWSDDFCKERKWDLKNLSTYFRLVKQGSILCYLSFHIFTIVSILFLAVVRQSLVSVGYVFILLPNLKNAADVLKQRLLEQDKQMIELGVRISEIEAWIERYEADLKLPSRDPTYSVEVALSKRHELEALRQERRALAKDQKAQSKTAEQKQDEKEKARDREWSIIRVITKYLLAYACVDFTWQTIC